jgi:hypothetical protein
MGKYIIGVGAQIKFHAKGSTPLVMRVCQTSYKESPYVSLIGDGTNGHGDWVAWSEAVPVGNIRELCQTEIQNLVGYVFPITDFSFKVWARWVKLSDVFAGETK